MTDAGEVAADIGLKRSVLQNCAHGLPFDVTVNGGYGKIERNIVTHHFTFAFTIVLVGGLVVTLALTITLSIGILGTLRTNRREKQTECLREREGR